MDYHVPSINLVARDNGVGLSRDLSILRETLRASGFDVTVTGIHGGKLTKWLRPPAKRIEWRYRRARGRDAGARFDVNIMLEHIWPDDLPFARHNVLIPNPEWFLPRDRRHLHRMDLVLAKTRHAERIFRRLGKPVMYTGFTGHCRFDPEQPRESSFFHLAGRSHAKGTERLLALWRRHPEWPLLTVVQNPRTARPGPPVPNIEHHVGYLDDNELRRLQNRHRFHLCPSETEGFGHYLVEAMTVGALTVTVDAAPMNELITPDRGLLVPCERTGTQHLATTHFFDEAAMERAVETAIRLDKPRLEQMGKAARAWHRENRENFGARLTQVLLRLLDAPDALTASLQSAQTASAITNSTLLQARRNAPAQDTLRKTVA